MFVYARIAARTAPLMFSLAMVFLICQAVLIVMWVDVPALREKALDVGGRSTVVSENLYDQESLEQVIQGPISPAQRVIERAVFGVMFLIWPIVIAESVYHWIIRPKVWVMRWFHFHSLLFCVCPSLRMCAKSAEMNERLWLPGLAWQRPDGRLRRRLERTFSIPMIGIALLILPVLMVEFLFKDQVARYLWLRVSLHIGTGVIWFAFASEFILMVSIAEKKMDYIRKNWVDLAIIALPFLSFLRSMQAMRGTRLARLAKVPQITRLARAYRLRGTVLKTFRALVLLDVSASLFRKTPDQRLVRMRAELAVAQREARLLRLQIVRLERQVAMTACPSEVRHTDGETAEGQSVSR